MDFPPDDAAGVSDTDLRRLLEQAKATNDDALRRLLASYITLRRMSAEMLTLIESREGAVTIKRTPIFQRLRHLTQRSAI